MAVIINEFNIRMQTKTEAYEDRAITWWESARVDCKWDYGHMYRQSLEFRIHLESIMMIEWRPVPDHSVDQFLEGKPAPFNEGFSDFVCSTDRLSSAKESCWEHKVWHSCTSLCDNSMIEFVGFRPE